MPIFLSFFSALIISSIAAYFVYSGEVEKEASLMDLKDKIKAGEMTKEMETYMLQKLDDQIDGLNGRLNKNMLENEKRFNEINTRFGTFEGTIKDMFSEFQTVVLEKIDEDRTDVLKLKWTKTALVGFGLFLITIATNVGVAYAINKINTPTTSPVEVVE